MKSFGFVSAIVCIVLSANMTARADTYCQYSGSRLNDGQTVTDNWRVVLGSIPREAIIGKADRTWCKVSFAGGLRGLWGNFQSYKVLEAPKNGQLHTFPGEIHYKGMRVGQDRIVLKVHWLSSRDNQPMSGTRAIDIEVVDHSL